MSPKGVPGRRGQKRPRDHHIAAPRASARVSSASRTDTPRWISAMPGPGRPCCEWPVTWSRRAARSGWPRPAGRCQDLADHGAGPEPLRGTLVASVYRAGRPRRTGHGTGQRAGEAATRLDAAGAATRRSALCASPGWRRQARRSPRRARPRKLHRSGCGSKPGSQPRNSRRLARRSVMPVRLIQPAHRPVRGLRQRILPEALPSIRRDSAGAAAPPAIAQIM